MPFALVGIESVASRFQTYLEEIQPKIQRMPRGEAGEKRYELLSERIEFIKAVGEYLSQPEMHDVALTKRLANVLLCSEVNRHSLLQRCRESGGFATFLTRVAVNPFYMPIVSTALWIAALCFLWYLIVFVNAVVGWLVLGFFAWQLYLKGRDSWKVQERGETWATKISSLELIRLEIEWGYFDAEECASRLRELFSRGVYVHSLIFPLLKLAKAGQRGQ